MHEVYEGKMCTYHALAVGRYAIEQNDAPQLFQARDVVAADGALLEEGVEVRHARCGADLVDAASVCGLCQWQRRRNVWSRAGWSLRRNERRVGHVCVREENTRDSLVHRGLRASPTSGDIRPLALHDCHYHQREAPDCQHLNHRCYDSVDAPALCASDMLNCARHLAFRKRPSAHFATLLLLLLLLLLLIIGPTMPIWRSNHDPDIALRQTVFQT